jgi:hypothetical protein
MNFVAECTTYSNPHRDGLARYGDANVLSTDGRHALRATERPQGLEVATVTFGFAIVST